jgi:hypothetical protein
VYPLISSDSKLIVVEIPRADGLAALFTPDEHYLPEVEAILDEMIWANVNLQQVFDFARGAELKYGTHKHTYHIFDANQYSAAEVKNWLRGQPQLAPYLGETAVLTTSKEPTAEPAKRGKLKYPTYSTRRH